MWSESEIQIFKKIFLDEMCCYSQNNKAEKEFDKMFEKLRNLDFSELHDEEVIDKIFEKFEIPPEPTAFFKDNFVVDPALSPEEHFKIGMRLCEEFFRIKQRVH